MKVTLPALPIDPHLPEISARFAEGKNLIIRATPGSGKTTRVPPAFLSVLELKNQEILVLEPRRLAAKLSAERVAAERGERIGETVGYHFRFEKRTGPKTRLTYLTEGMLIRRLLSDPILRGVGAIVLDEFHERSLHADIALAAVTHLQKGDRPDLRLTIMSATLEQAALQQFLDNACLIEIDTPRFDLSIEYLASPPVRHLEQLVAQSVTNVLRSDKRGHVLVFLPGMQEIRRSAEALSPLARNHSLAVYPLHGELKREEQELALSPSSLRKIILSTNVAETSLTIDGVQIVIDSGLHRQARFSPWSGIPSLHTRSVSKASATQRAGRAARQGPGFCQRLYTKSDFEQRSGFDVPEILRSDLSQFILEIKRWGKADDISYLRFLDPPAPASLSRNADLLWRLGALAQNSVDAPLTEIGKRLAEIPVHPRIGRILIEAEGHGLKGMAALFCALLSEGDFFSLNAFDSLKRPVSEHVRRVAQTIGENSDVGVINEAKLESLCLCVLKGFPDRVAKRRQLPKSHEKEIELLLSGGEIARAPFNETTHDSDLFVVVNVQEQKTQNREWLRASALIPIALETLLDLDPSPLGENQSLTWDSGKNAVIQKTSLRCGVLSLEETSKLAGFSSDTARVLIREGLKISADETTIPEPHVLFAALGRSGMTSEPLEDFYERLLLLDRHLKNSGLLPWREIWGHLFKEFEKANSFVQLREVDWKAALTTSISASITSRLDFLLPAQVQIGAGRRVTVHYPPNGTPWIESRIQDFFGLKRGPSILDGSLPLALHLLAPNRRPVQVTTDLASFWEKTYPDLRKALSRRYPRHNWPEDPTLPLRSSQ